MAAVPPSVDTLVVAVDFSKPSRKAYDAALALAKDLGATLVLVHAFAPVPKAGVRDPIGQVEVEVDEADWEVLRKEWVSAAKGVTVETVGRAGKPADVVAAVVAERKASMVVVGSHGRTGLKRTVLGSVAESIVRTSKVPVVVVPA
jgi:nucleotide-binding universal stress UspA family protein